MPAERELIEELGAAGVSVIDSLQELDAAKDHRTESVQILVRWLEHIDEWSDPDDTFGRLEDDIVRALRYPGGGRCIHCR